jgi:hypothetical protein
MIKLTELLSELEKPTNLYAPGKEQQSDFLKQGFRTKNQVTNPETGTVSSDVEYLPAFENVRRSLLQYRKEFQPFKYHADESIAKSAKDLNTILTKAANLVFVLDKMIELQRK